MEIRDFHVVQEKRDIRRFRLNTRRHVKAHICHIHANIRSHVNARMCNHINAHIRGHIKAHICSHINTHICIDMPTFVAILMPIFLIILKPAFQILGTSKLIYVSPETHKICHISEFFLIRNGKWNLKATKTGFVFFR